MSDHRFQNIFSEAILAMLKAPVADVNGLLDLDEDFLRRHSDVSDFSTYSVFPGSNPRRIMPKYFPTLSVDEQNDEGNRWESIALRKAKL